MFTCSVITAFLLFVGIQQTGASCSFPSQLDGYWQSSSMGLLQFINGTIMSGYKVGNRGLKDFECLFQSDSRYILRSETFTVLGDVVRAVLCFDLNMTSDYVSYYYLYTSELADAGYQRIKFVEPDLNITEAVACDDTSLQIGQYSLLVQNDTIDNANIICPDNILASFTYNCSSSQGWMDVCSDTTKVTFNTTACSEVPGYSVGGEGKCVFSLTDGSLTYLTVYNLDAYTDETNNYRFTCYAIMMYGSNVYITQHPEECSLYQNATDVQSPGNSYVLDPGVTCVPTTTAATTTTIATTSTTTTTQSTTKAITTTEAKTTPAPKPAAQVAVSSASTLIGAVVGGILVILFVIALVIAYMVIRKRKREQNKVDVEVQAGDGEVNEEVDTTHKISSRNAQSNGRNEPDRIWTPPDDTLHPGLERERSALWQDGRTSRSNPVMSARALSPSTVRASLDTARLKDLDPSFDYDFNADDDQLEDEIMALGETSMNEEDPTIVATSTDEMATNNADNFSDVLDTAANTPDAEMTKLDNEDCTASGTIVDELIDEVDTPDYQTASLSSNIEATKCNVDNLSDNIDITANTPDAEMTKLDDDTRGPETDDLLKEADIDEEEVMESTEVTIPSDDTIRDDESMIHEDNIQSELDSPEIIPTERTDAKFSQFPQETAAVHSTPLSTDISNLDSRLSPSGRLPPIDGSSPILVQLEKDGSMSSLGMKDPLPPIN